MSHRWALYRRQPWRKVVNLIRYQNQTIVCRSEESPSSLVSIQIFQFSPNSQKVLVGGFATLNGHWTWRIDWHPIQGVFSILYNLVVFVSRTEWNRITENGASFGSYEVFICGEFLKKKGILVFKYNTEFVLRNSFLVMHKMFLVHLMYLYGLKSYLKSWQHYALESLVYWFCLDQICFNKSSVPSPSHKHVVQHTDVLDTCITPGCLHSGQSVESHSARSSPAQRKWPCTSRKTKKNKQASEHPVQPQPKAHTGSHGHR